MSSSDGLSASQRANERVRARLAELTGIPQERAAIKHHIRKVLREYVDNGGSLGFPVDLEDLSKSFGIAQIRWSRTFHADAALIPEEGGFHLWLKSPTVSIGRLRFSWAHELAHTLFFDVTCKPPLRTTPVDAPLEEELCDIAAREILLPEKTLAQGFHDLSGRCGTAEIVVRSAKLAAVSPEVIASRLIELGFMDSVIVAGWLAMNSKKGAPYSLSWVRYPPESQLRLRESVRIMPPSILHKCRVVGLEVTECDMVPWVTPKAKIEWSAVPFSKRVTVSAIRRYARMAP